MTELEKRELLGNICGNADDCCTNCPFHHMEDAWCEKYNHMTVPVDELNRALEYVDIKTGNAVNHPSHYNQGGIECIDAMVAAFGKEKVADFCIINAFKYLWRYEHKNGKEDTDKAIWYMNKYKELTDSMEGANEEVL